MAKQKLYRIFNIKNGRTEGYTQASSLPVARYGLPPMLNAEVCKYPVKAWDHLSDRWFPVAGSVR